ncbi:cellulase family glycosylhydrolase [Paenibacillus psychroresistens]|nr:cellulase family glycosylhydrolase [Paenibacillus psychroresistens]
MIRFGVNYVPSKKWWYSWLDWNPESILEDLQAIRSLGMDHIRIHCLWPIFQPNPDYVSETALNRLYELLNIADECSMDVQITVLNGWLSGFSFYPAWKGDRNLFTNREMIKAEKFLFQQIANKVKDHPKFMGFDLGNEINVLTWKGDRFSMEEGDLWQTEMMSFCELVAPGKFHVNGVDQIHGFRIRAFLARL